MNDNTQDPNSESARNFLQGAEPGYERLRDSDPAANDAPDRAALRDLVRERLAPVAAAGQPLPPSRPPMRWMKVAAAAAAVLAVGVGGYAIGTTRDGGQQVAATVEVPMTDAVNSAGPAIEPPAAVPGQQGNVGVPGGPAVTEGDAAPAIGLDSGQGLSESSQGSGQASGQKLSADAARSSYLGWSRTVFTDGGVTGEAGTAAAWALDPGQVVSADTAARLAAALGVVGEPRQEYGTWVVGPTDGTGPTLSLGGDGAASVNYYNPTADAYYCPQPTDPQMTEVAPAPDATAGGEVSDGISIDPMPMPTECEQRDVGLAPQGEEAIAKAKDILTLLGLDPATFNFEAGAADASNPGYGWVTAYSVLNDQRTGVNWQVSFSGPELSSVSGSLAPLVSVGDYPIISAAQAVQRLSDPRFGAAGVAYPIDYVWPEGEPYVEPTDVVVPPLPAAGGQISWPVTEVTITSAQLGVAMQYQNDGSVLLLPTYSLSDASGVSWSVIAVADSALNFTG